MRKSIFYSLLLLSIWILAAKSNEGSPRVVDPKPISNLKAAVTGLKVSLSWDAPNFTNDVVLAENFDQNQLPEGWSNIDVDNDGKFWEFLDVTASDIAPSGKCMSSWSWYAGLSTKPDNWLVSKKIKVPINGILRYNVGGRNAIWLNDTYAVMLSETDSDIESFNTTLIEENLSSPIRSNAGSKDKDLSNEVWFDREIDLKAYEGKDVYIAFRHYKSENEFCVVLDNVSVIGEDPNAMTPSFTYNVYRDEELIKNTDNLNFVETLDSPGSYLYEVEVLYEDGQVSPKVGKLVNVQEPSQTAYIRLQAHDVWLDGTGYQILLDSSASLFGSLIPAIGPLTYNCNVFYLNPSPFSHSVPENADISCSPYNWIVNGKSELVPIPAGTYDYCITNPNPGSMIYIASSEFGRGNDFVFEAGMIYTFKARMNPENPDLGDFIELTVESSFAPVVSLESTTNAAGDVTLNWLAPESKRAVVIEENFENSMPSDWTTIDADGDGHNWLVGTDLGYMGVDGSGSFCVRSASWDEEPLTPDNYLVTPKLNLSEGGRLSFWVCAQDASWPEDHYAVYASTSGNEVADFTELLFEETVTAKSGGYFDKSLISRGGTKVQGTWRKRVVELPAGTNYVAFRHFNSVNVFWLLIDDVRITDDLGNQDCSYTISLLSDKNQEKTQTICMCLIHSW